MQRYAPRIAVLATAERELHQRTAAWQHHPALLTVFSPTAPRMMGVDEFQVSSSLACSGGQWLWVKLALGVQCLAGWFWDVVV